MSMRQRPLKNSTEIIRSSLLGCGNNYSRPVGGEYIQGVPEVLQHHCSTRVAIVMNRLRQTSHQMRAKRRKFFYYAEWKDVSQITCA